MSTEQALLLIGIAVILVAPMVFLVRFSPQTEAEEKSAMERALGRRESDRVILAPSPAD